MQAHQLLLSLVFCASASLVFPISAGNFLAVDPKLNRFLLDNDFESGSVTPWYDESPGKVNWRVENVSSPIEANLTAPHPAVGTFYLRAARKDNTSYGLAVFNSPDFTANPGDRVSFDFWIRSRRPEGNNLELFWMVGTTETLIVSLSQFSTAANFDWRSESVEIPVNGASVGHLSFHGYCGVYPEDAIAVDNIVVESSSLSTPTPGTGCIRLGATVGIFTSPNYPSDYPNNANVCWLITDVSYVSLHFNSFETELGKDGLKIYLGETISSPLYADLTGTYFPNSVFQYTDAMLFVFTSDSANTKGGFSISYDVIKASPPTTTLRTSTTTESSSSRPVCHSFSLAVVLLMAAMRPVFNWLRD